MVGPKEKKYVDDLIGLGKKYDFDVILNEHFANRHYNPDLIWKLDDKLIGFEVEYSDDGPSNKHFIGDAYWLNKYMNIGFIIIRGKMKSLNKLLNFLKEKHSDFKNIFIIDVEKLDQIIKILKQNL